MRGSARLVPVAATYSECPGVLFGRERADQTFHPGARTSGFNLPSAINPVEEKYAWYLESNNVAPVERSFLQLAGTATTSSGPSFPPAKACKKPWYKKACVSSDTQKSLYSPLNPTNFHEAECKVT